MNDLLSLIKKKPLLIPGSYDCLSALLVEKVGFKATYLSGAGLSVSLLGKPDIGLLTRDEVVSQARRMAQVLKIPLIVDCDTGFGGPLNVARTVRDLEAAGVAAIQIEDQTFPKRCGHLEGKTVVPAVVMVEKIQAAVKARRSKRFAIIARTDARGVTSLGDALTRAVLYKKAGADIIFPEALRSREEFRVFGRIKGLGTLMANMTEFGHSPSLTVSELARLGFRMVLFPMTAFRVAAFAMEKTLKDLSRKGSSRSWLNRMQTRQELYKLNHYQEFNDRERKWIEEIHRKTMRGK